MDIDNVGCIYSSINSVYIFLYIRFFVTLDTICSPLQSHEFKHCLIISLSRKYVSHAYSNALSMSLSNLLASP